MGSPNIDTAMRKVAQVSNEAIADIKIAAQLRHEKAQGFLRMVLLPPVTRVR